MYVQIVCSNLIFHNCLISFILIGLNSILLLIMTENKKNTLYSIKCCNPYQKITHSNSGKLRTVTSWMCSSGYNIEKDMKICDGCRIKLSKDFAACSQTKQSKFEESLPSASTSENFSDPDTSLDYLNKSLELVGESPIKKRRLKRQSYARKKIEKVKTCFQKTFLSNSNDFQEESEENDDEFEMLQQLKEKFSQTTERSEKITILTLLPASWSQRKIQKEFGASDYMVRTVKKLVIEKGILSNPNPKPGKTLDETTFKTVIDFYNSDEVSRVMPGKKDFVSVKSADGTRIHLQKRLVLANLKEIYQMFKEMHMTQKVGFSKFCSMRPKNCILAGKSGSHAVCVCTSHQNVKLMLNGSGINKFVLEGDETTLKDYKVCLTKIMCNPPLDKCYMDECKNCPGIATFKNQLYQKFEEEMIDNVTYKKWIATDRCTMETVIKTTEDFIDDFTSDLAKLKKHSFIANQQKKFYSYLKENLKSGEILVTCDFSENYSFVLQDEVQSYHWTNTQATIHPFLVYYKTDSNILEHLNYVFISECLKHNTIAFNLFQTHLVAALNKNLKINKIFYFSDGSAAQYKNKKNFLNTCMHKIDFGIDAEWHFFATSHGKSSCDGLGGTVKRLATKASLQRPYENHIITPRQLYDFANKNIPSINFMYCTNEEYSENEKKLFLRFDNLRTISGTQRIHAIIPLSESQMVTKSYSFSSEEHTESLFPSESGDTQELNELQSGFVTINYEGSWWLACILAKNKESNYYKVSFLHPKGPAQSFYYPKPRADILEIPLNDILKRVDPCTATGRTYTLTQEEMVTTSTILDKKLKHSLQD